MARAGMATLIARLRSMCEAGTADYAVAGTTYWSDDELQAILDSHRMEITRENLVSRSEYVSSGSAVYKDYFSAFRNFEEASGGSAVWDVEDGDGDSIGTANYSVNYDAGHLRFTSDTLNASYYLTARSYNINRAAAEVWQRKAAHYASSYDFAADGARFDRSQMHAHALDMVKHFKNAGGIAIGRLVRTD